MEAKIVACHCFFLRPMVATRTRIWKLSRTGHEQITNRSRTDHEQVTNRSRTDHEQNAFAP